MASLVKSMEDGTMSAAHQSTNEHYGLIITLKMLPMPNEYFYCMI